MPYPAPFLPPNFSDIVGSPICSVCEKFQAKRAKVAPVKLICGSHFSGTEATYEVSQYIYIYILYNHYVFTRGRRNYRQPNFMLSQIL